MRCASSVTLPRRSHAAETLAPVVLQKPPLYAVGLFFFLLYADDLRAQRQLERAGEEETAPVRAGGKHGGIKAVFAAVRNVDVHSCPVRTLAEVSSVENMESCSLVCECSSSASIRRTAEVFSLP